MSTKQIKNGKAFEYAIAKAYEDFLKRRNIPVLTNKDSAFQIAKSCFESFEENEKLRFFESARVTIDTLVKIEPGFIAAKDKDDILNIRIAKDAEGIDGDVRVEKSLKFLFSSWDTQIRFRSNL